jgi:hypothetical protein
MAGWEAVSSATVPFDLSVRLVVGEALEVLSFLIETGDMPEHGKDVLKQVLEELLPDRAQSNGRTKSSIADDANAVDLLSKTAQRRGLTDTEAVRKMLESVIGDVETLSKGTRLPKERVKTIYDELSVIHDAMAAARAVETDDPGDWVRE